MTENHPITPPPELVHQWLEEADTFRFLVKQVHQYVATRAAQWGADEELEACRMEIIDGVGRSYIDETRDRTCLAIDLWTARRPKPLSLKEQALEALMTADGPDHPTPMLYLRLDAASIIRRALESIPESSQ